MKVRFGSLEVTFNIEGQTGDALDLTLRDIINSSITVKSRQVKKPLLGQPAYPEPEYHDQEIEEDGEPTDESGIDSDFKLLQEVGLSRKTMSMISGKVLGMKAHGSTLDSQFPFIKQRSLEFLNRQLKEEYWALFVRRIHYREESAIAVLGLNQNNQINILAVEPAKSPKDFYQRLMKRGLRASAVKIGVLSLHLDGGSKDFKVAFPNAKIGLDWNEYISIQVGEETKVKLGQALKSTDTNFIKKMVAQVKAPKELLTFTEFKKTLWRPLRSTGAITRIEKDLKTKLRSKAIHSEDQKLLVKVWSIIRLQYQWLKVPVDAPQLANLNELQYLKEDSLT